MRAIAVALISVCCLVTPEVAHAGAEADRATARELFNEGLDLRKDGKHAEALAKFRAADALVSTPRTRLELGKELVAVGKHVEGLAALRSVATIPVEAKDVAKYAPVKNDAAELAAAVDAKLPRVTLVIDAGATAKLDGNVVLSADDPIGVDPGRHVAESDGPTGHRREEFRAEPGASLTIDLRSSPAARPASPGTASRWPPMFSTGFFAVGTVALVGSGVFGVLAWSANDRSKPHCDGGCTEEGARLREQAGSRADVSTVLFGASAICASVGIVYWILKPNAAESPPVALRVSPVAIAIEGRF